MKLCGVAAPSHPGMDFCLNGHSEHGEGCAGRYVFTTGGQPRRCVRARIIPLCDSHVAPFRDYHRDSIRYALVLAHVLHALDTRTEDTEAEYLVCLLQHSCVLVVAITRLHEMIFRSVSSVVRTHADVAPIANDGVTSKAIHL